MLTVGIDLASADERTAVCGIGWEPGRATVTQIACTASDASLLQLIAQADKAGIDVPLGWPEEFADAIAAHRADLPWPNVPPARLRYRATDRYVQRRTGRWPLSVSTDRIGVPAMRAAALFSRLKDQGAPVSRDGSGRVVEVYPAAALAVWGFNAVGYKRTKGADARLRLLTSIEERTRDWLDFPPDAREMCRRSDDALDALVAAMVAQAAAVGLCETIPLEHHMAAMREGWIAIPRPDSLENLADRVPAAHDALEGDPSPG